jgi:hypothetical protein
VVPLLILEILELDEEHMPAEVRISASSQSVAAVEHWAG